MTDEQTWAILTAPAEATDHQLAEQLGLTYAAVHGRRWTLRTEGWTCKVRFARCLYCDEMMTLPPSRSRTDYPYHPDCHEQYRRDDVNRRYHRSPIEERKARSQNSRIITSTAQEESLAKAVNRGAPWTDSEDAYLAENLHRTARELAAELNRSYYAVESRVKRMRMSKRH